MASKNGKTQRTNRTKKTYIAKPLPAEGFVRLPSILGALQISKTSFFNGIKTRKYPEGQLLSPRCRVWPVEVIRQLLEELAKPQIKPKHPISDDKLLNTLNKSKFVKDRDGKCIATDLIGRAKFDEKLGFIVLKARDNNLLGYLDSKQMDGVSDE